MDLYGKVTEHHAKGQFDFRKDKRSVCLLRRMRTPYCDLATTVELLYLITKDAFQLPKQFFTFHFFCNYILFIFFGGKNSCQLQCKKPHK
jgi:hypothetical protein